ncbi:alpha,alpha-trehalose-phosphate synthase (UDP-forming) [Polymorphobacter fuscus]|uniref:Trehalose-6-phosphate synthase n=1 Tax=Sandarakinorhabdus fusca TaxID=1439888 RepID=A0A7C9GQV1_9SPHN|nr:trehalose-6-phosphate synthase [Polymorphobacter fuscus]KAB7645566.1 trehalose-6-phosphate synthase [Polymorphobacter fuscus]MQT18013.1 trehalose-6-phosphate synthase [Polymorphobacter fuscus]NJC08642.1 trehalose 6-phosphate synthase [Polymorphobacter fuscus]
MSRLIVVSNRVTAPSGQPVGGQGGLSVALAEALREYGGLWFGWSGQSTAEFTGHLNLARTDGITTATIDLEEQDIHEYYHGYANRTLWPLFHYRIDLTEYDRTFDAGYARVNQRFADTLVPIIEPDDVIWVHDYHLIPLAMELRKRGITNRIGFFLHIPWPPPRLLTTLPHHQALVATLFDYDLVGFQTGEWLEAFQDYLAREVAAPVEDGSVTAFGKTIRIGAFPIGIDTAAFQTAAESPAALATRARIAASIDGRQMIIGVDRLDYSKGLEERFLGYERFLADNPDLCQQVFLLQIAPPTRGDIGSYQEIRSKLDTLSGRINGAYAEIDWVPIRYVNRGYGRHELAAIYRSARIGIVTPLRDGMNLVAKEYVAAQDPADPGVLILSKFAGAALQLPEALLINPYSQEEIADAIKVGLAMPLEERQRRWTRMIEGVVTDDVVKWRTDFVTTLEQLPLRADTAGHAHA